MSKQFECMYCKAGEFEEAWKDGEPVLLVCNECGTELEYLKVSYTERINDQ
jgi:transcription elongation factor Elf1